MKTYTLNITRQQALTLQVACEVLARLGLGQFRDALEHLPTSEWRPEGWNEDMDVIGAARAAKEGAKHGNPHD